MLMCFELASRPKVNFHKNRFVGIRVAGSALGIFVSLLNYRTMEIPFTYLEIPIGSNPWKEATWMPMVLKMQSKQSAWKHKHLYLGEQIFLINSILFAHPLECLGMSLKNLLGPKGTSYWGRGKRKKRNFHGLVGKGSVN